MARFEPPFGGAIQHVADPKRNRGYHYVVAWGVDLGSYAYYIEMSCAEAENDDAPKNAIYKGRDGHWRTVDELRDARQIQRYEDYVAALTRYAEDLAAERRHRR
ncbi:hypothetical protein [Streptomyces violaceusniger]|uniref:Uncharacterized protein n=1 Tax=Streptomyces violaceusniger TaxID=68280 RepID=A0A4D4LMH9_STRVO|nr:hypothetical protein SVIO_102610 [Streptomyces violaceusniger]